MKAPEKIYMTPSFGEPDNVLLASFSKSHLDFHRDIEYIRKDAFIEKACEFLNDRIKHDSIDYPIATVHLIDDFKNYMKEV